MLAAVPLQGSRDNQDTYTCNPSPFAVQRMHPPKPKPLPHIGQPAPAPLRPRDHAGPCAPCAVAPPISSTSPAAAAAIARLLRRPRPRQRVRPNSAAGTVVSRTL